MLLPLLATVMLTATANTEAPLEQAIARVWKPMSAAQAAAFRTTAPEVCYSGRKFGLKSNTIACKGTSYAQRFGPNRINPKTGEPYPAARVILCREERAAMEQTMLVTLRDEILGPELFAALYKGPPEDGLIFPNGSRVAFRGLDQPRRIQGMRYGFAACDQAEELAEDQFTILDAGCTQVGMPWTQTFCAFNPEGPGHWAYLRYTPDSGDGPRYLDGKHFADVVHVKFEDGLHLLSPQQRDKLDRMTGVWAQRLRFGKWVGFEGLVFDTFDPAFHVKQRPASWARWDGLPPPDWPRYRGIDFGFVHPWACVWITRSPSGTLGVYRQMLLAGKTIEEQCAMIIKAEREELDRLRRAADEESVRQFAPYLSDLNLAGSWSDHEAGHRAQYDAHGVWTQLARKETNAGIECVRDLLDPRYLDPEGYPRLWIAAGSLSERDRRLQDSRRPTSLEEEMVRWTWRTAKTSGGARTMKDEPVDVGEDATKALIYAVHSLEAQGALGVY